ncbi:hypothetical protein AQUSIP_14670 [Aquicella siphonis]|uniref:Permuted papain-like amidase enzyme, YaeF/YiiX, C92 family n=1 Tax=Aquicella siphonis TaxID=254247 RepID=A0A5E4PIF0_9COXI|nr:YiiX/YebB-like N1pC/P60 family cysteine hydrolase [Aquicella siphonis]VVC76162.1 hypothetical protein AQUSIP_14670 [Aquicella siphonis]
MFKSAYLKLRDKINNWLINEPAAAEIMPYDFNRLKYEIRPGDVLLVEGRSRISKIIRTITQSPWTHAALYIGRMIDFEDEEIKKLVRSHLPDEISDNTRLIVEDMLDQGTVITPLNFYHNHHIRICRPIGITPADLHLVVNYAIKALGQPYNVRHLLDLTRFMLPWTILPRRWGSSLFRTSSGEPESGICSSLIAEAFTSVHFPILPFVKPDEVQGIEVFQRNPYLFTPKDFDYSPYFEIIKYPLFNPDEPLPYYRRLPWTKSGFLHHDDGILAGPQKKTKKSLFKRKEPDLPETQPEQKERASSQADEADTPKSSHEKEP